MNKILNLPHRVCKSTCFSNGLEDILEWKGKKYINYLLPVLGGMGEFTYLKFKNTNRRIWFIGEQILNTY
jgi:hypothetical protein